MLPVVDKPLIQYAVEEALAAGATRLVFITGASKRAIEDHFDSDQELELLLEPQGKSDLLNQLRSVLPSYASCIYIRQPAPLGLGHAVLCAQPAVGAEPFFVHLADDLIDAAKWPASQQMARGLRRQARQRARRARWCRARTPTNTASSRWRPTVPYTSRVRSIVEKPKPAVAPSNLAVVGRYVLAPAIFEHLERIGQRRGRRDPAHRRHRRADARGGGVRLSLRRASATTAAASSATCRRPWSTRSAIRRWAGSSAAIFRPGHRGRGAGPRRNARCRHGRHRQTPHQRRCTPSAESAAARWRAAPGRAGCASFLSLRTPGSAPQSPGRDRAAECRHSCGSA